MKIRNRVRKIGITGCAGAGKTTFLLSLINNLEVNGLDLGSGKTRRFRALDLRESPISTLCAALPESIRPLSEKRLKFPYIALRKHFAKEKKWSQKTTDSSFFRCHFERPVANPLFHPVDQITRDEVEFFDFPGERVADVTMIDRSFDQWSDKVLRNLNEDPDKNLCATAFFHQIESEAIDAAKIISAWKHTLGLLILSNALITPSTFLIDPDGNEAKERTAEKLASNRCAGLKDREFTPLSEDARRRMPKLSQEFKEHYEDYQRRVVVPFAANLLSCDALVILVDVADLLGSGVHKLNDIRETIGRLLECVDQKQKFAKQVARTIFNALRLLTPPYGFLFDKQRSINRIAFVASQADRMRENDRDKLKPLIKDLVEPVTRNARLNEKNFGFFRCSAVVSTQALPGDDRKLVGRPIWLFTDDRLDYLPPDSVERVVDVPELPSEWADRWCSEDYQFVKFHPNVPPNFGKPPNQAGLDDVLKFVLDV